MSKAERKYQSLIDQPKSFFKMEKFFIVSSKKRVFLSGYSLVEQDIKQIHILEKQFREKYTSFTTKEITSKIADEMKMDERTIRKYMGENSTILIGGRRKAHNTEALEFITNFVKLNPETYLREIKAALQNQADISVGITSIWNYMTRNLKMSRKKVVKYAFYLTLPRVQLLRANFRAIVKLNHPWSYVFVDESHFDSKSFEVLFFI